MLKFINVFYCTYSYTVNLISNYTTLI